jgi:hypothetical protein
VRVFCFEQNDETRARFFHSHPVQADSLESDLPPHAVSRHPVNMGKAVSSTADGLCRARGLDAVSVKKKHKFPSEASSSS